jgi:hypothetical protein
MPDDRDGDRAFPSLVWWMRNQQGYADGQLAFGAVEEAASCTIQVITGARVFQVVAVDLKSRLRR